MGSNALDEAIHHALLAGLVERNGELVAFDRDHVSVAEFHVKDAVADASKRIRAAGKPVREDFMKYVWINDVLVSGARQLFGT